MAKLFKFHHSTCAIGKLNNKKKYSLHQYLFDIEPLIALNISKLYLFENFDL